MNSESFVINLPNFNRWLIIFTATLCGICTGPKFSGILPYTSIIRCHRCKLIDLHPENRCLSVIYYVNCGLEVASTNCTRLLPPLIFYLAIIKAISFDIHYKASYINRSTYYRIFKWRKRIYELCPGFQKHFVSNSLNILSWKLPNWPQHRKWY